MIIVSSLVYLCALGSAADEVTAPTAIGSTTTHFRVLDAILPNRPSKREPLQCRGENDIALVFPCSSADWPLGIAAMASVAAQTVLPCEIIIAMSMDERHRGLEMQLFNKLMEPNAVNDAWQNYTQSRYTRIFPPFKKSLVDLASRTTIYVRRYPWKVGQNRLLGCVFTTAPIVTFFDMDDFMMKNRLERIQQAFKRHPELDVVLTGTKLNNGYDIIGTLKEFDDDIYFTWPENPKDDFIMPYSFFHEIAEKAEKPFTIHHFAWNQIKIDKETHKIDEAMVAKFNTYRGATGWPAMRRDVLYKYSLRPDDPWGEDNHFIYDLLMDKKNVNVISRPLGLYLKNW